MFFKKIQIFKKPKVSAGFIRAFFVPAVFTFAAFAFWLKYSAGQNYWWIISIMLIFAGHYYFYYVKKEDY